MAGEFGLGVVLGSAGNPKLIGNALQIDLDRLRKLVRNYIDNHQYQSALFWADKIVSFSNRSTEDLFWFAQCLFLTKQYHRAATCIRSQKLYKTDLSCAYLAARSHYAGKEYKEALEILDSIVDDENKAPNSTNLILNISNEGSNACELQSSLLLLKGQVLEAMDNRGLAADCYREALQKDIFCYEAFYALVQHHMLSKEEEESLIKSLAISKSNSKEEGDLVKFLYEMQLKKYDKPSQLIVPTKLAGLQNNMDLATSMAERHYYNCDYQQCFRITSNVLNKDPFHTQCLPIHISCLVELRKSNALFYLAHKLVDLYPENAISWFAVGCYYLLIKKTDAARRYLSKATTLDRVFGPGWLVYGHSFAVENEHDQAMAAYFKASQLMKGCHLPLLYIGLEYGLTNNTKLAEKFFTQALAIAPEDPFVLHELGVVAFQSEDYELAEKKFLGALEQVQNSGESVLPEKWEPLLNNLGHTSRKLKKYQESLEYHQHALVLLPQNAATYSAIGYVHALMEHWAEAVEYFHKALGFQRDDTFSTTMLTNAIEQLMNNMSPCDVPKELPLYTSSASSVDIKKDDIRIMNLETISEASTVSMDMETDNTNNDL